jgi:uncharacterized protein (DUF305 family)
MWRGLVPVLSVVLLAACGTPGAPPSSGAASAQGTVSTPGNAQVRGDNEFNETDVMFLQMLIPHHGQGQAIVRLAATRTGNDRIKQLASAIDVTQADEIKTMAGWLTAWGQPLEADESAHAAHGGMPGTSAEEIAVLEKMTGVAFERAFLNMLIAHQDDAVQVARMETAGGINPKAVALAQRVDASRTGQVKQMLDLLKALPSG